MEIESIYQDVITTPRGVNIALVDLECTCNNDDIFGPHEIIEIGVIVGKLSIESFDIADELQIYVKPTINTTLTDFCTDLTGITQHTVDSATTLDKALPILDDWLKKQNVAIWGSWGKFDASQFSRECHSKYLGNPMADLQHLNVKQLFARKFGHRVGLQRALVLRNLVFRGRLHSGIDDAKNVAQLVLVETELRKALFQRITKK